MTENANVILWVFFRKNIKHSSRRLRSHNIPDLLFSNTVTKSTLRMQTSTAPSLKNVKQSTKAWNSLTWNGTSCSMCHISNILKCYENTFIVFNNVANTDESPPPYPHPPAITGKKSHIQEFKRNIHELSQIAPCTMSDPSSKFHENPCMHPWQAIIWTNNGLFNQIIYVTQSQ